MPGNVHLDLDQTVAGSTGMSYRVAQKTVVGADVLYGSGLRRGFANSEHVPGYVYVNGSVMQAFDFGPLGKLSARLSVLNLFDRSYQLRDGSGIGVGAPQFGARRTIYVAISKPFSF